MPIRLDEENDGKILVVQVSGKLTKADYEHFAPRFKNLVPPVGKMRLLFDMASFRGWDVRAAWEGLKLFVAHFEDMEQLAIVGENPWQRRSAAFCRPLIKATVRYFDRAHAADARRWFTEHSLADLARNHESRPSDEWLLSPAPREHTPSSEPLAPSNGRLTKASGWGEDPMVTSRPRLIIRPVRGIHSRDPDQIKKTK